MSADGSQIVWHRSDSTLLDDARMMPQGTLRTRDSPVCGFPQSPSGNKCVCVFFACAEIWLQNSDGSEARKLAVPLPQPASGGQLSPDGKQLLFSMSATPEQDYSYTTTLFLTDVDSAQPAVPLPTAGLPPNTIAAASWRAR